MRKTTVLIVDDSALIRNLFRDMLSSQPDIEVVDTAVDPFDAREKIKQHNPQVLTLDIEMPKMDGISFLEKIMALRPMPVIMISTLTQKGAEATLRALELGAVDYISKPIGQHNDGTLDNLKEELIAKVRAAANANISYRTRIPTKHSPQPLGYNPPSGHAHVIAIGSSTGGVEALRDIFLLLPSNVPPIVMTQHMPQQFTPSFAARLNSISEVEVSEARDGMKLMQGHAYLAPGNRHLKVVKSGKELVCRIEDGMPVSGHRPSVDVLFQSIAETAGSRAIGVILTGMGKDGAAGMLKMRECGAYNIGQNQSSCVVYGMPKVAQSLGAVHIELPLQEIAAHILAHCEERKSSHAI